MTQKELKARYAAIAAVELWPNDIKMQKYIAAECAYIVELEDGDITVIEKPRIKKDFCFAAGMYACATQEELDLASDNAENARTNTGYFIAKNLKQIEIRIEALKNPLLCAYKRLNYMMQKSGSKLKSVELCYISENIEYNPGRWSCARDLQELTQGERDALIAGYEAVKIAFVKRLNTYLKRYGLSRVNAWSYISD